MGYILGELRKPSSRRYKCLLTVVYENTSDPLARHYQQQSTVSDDNPDSGEGRNEEEALEVDRTHIEESKELHHNPSPYMESSNPKQERKTEEQITSRNGDRHEKNERELDRTREEVPGRSVMENALRRSMLHWEKQE
ncbi:unnamed protein product [Schistosoma curassoni]|uniref:Uncharacterized protein n=1 Tax=Schistosoma curassoni TaxID=6186 RepID=A0A183KPK1_9TREM|nr:unnamed protein product [Schistosoma curassoni]